MSPAKTMHFRDLEPPPGGKARLQRALGSAEEVARASSWQRWIPAAAAILLMAWLAPFAARTPGRDVQAREALEAAVGSPANGFESRSAEVMENTRPAGGVRFVVLGPARDVKRR